MKKTTGKKNPVQCSRTVHIENGTSQKVIPTIGFKTFFSPARSLRTVLAYFLFTAAVSFSGCATGPIEFYQGPLNHLNALRDGTCPMYPSCSSYAKTAVEKHGPLVGWMMTSDRLIRCGRDETDLAREIYVNDKMRFHDPVAHNDFWWHETQEYEYLPRRHE